MSGQNLKNDSIEDVAEFYDSIDRYSLIKKISPNRPYVYTTMEIYDAKNGIRGAGGLGVLAADTRRTAEILDIPFVALTPFYRTERHQKISDLKPEFEFIDKSPEKEGFSLVGQSSLKVKDQADAKLDIYQKTIGSTRFLCITENNFGPLYADEPSSDHRLYQMVALGFCGYNALKILNLKPAVIQLNETATIFSAIARLDELCVNGMNLYEAIVYVRKHTLYTNHTLVQAAESAFDYNQFERFVFPNIKSSALRRYLSGLFSNIDGKLKLSTITIELAEAKNCVSKLHARVANYRDINDEKVEFRSITNGIDLDTWVQPEILAIYRKYNIVDKFNMPTEDYYHIINQVFGGNSSEIKNLKSIKQAGRKKLNKELENRQDQYGNAVQIPDDAILYGYKRRFVAYKRPWMPFEDTERLKQILLKNNAHYIMAGIMAGNTYANDTTYKHLQKMLQQIADDKILRERVHYIADYDENLAKAMSFGVDVSINVPIVGLEACGTSFMKDIANLNLLISTNDGGVADVKPSVILQVSGTEYKDEIESLYKRMGQASDIIKDINHWSSEVGKVLMAYLPIICASRMMRDYLKFLFR